MLLNYPPARYTFKKPRELKESLGGEEEAAIYDLIFNDVPLRTVALKIGLSYQGVYIRALTYMRKWSRLGKLALDQEYTEELTKEE